MKKHILCSLTVFMAIISIAYIAYGQNMIIVNNLMDAIVESDNSNKDILLIFSSEYCGPCVRMKKDIRKNSELFQNLIVCSIDIDKNKEIAKEYRVRSIPDYLILRKREEIKRRKGYSNIENLLQWLSE